MRVLAMLSVTLLAACASSGPKPGEGTMTQTVRMTDAGGGTAGMTLTSTTTSKIEIIAAPLEKVWMLLPIAYDTLGIPVADFDAKKYLIGNSALKIRRRLGKTSLARYLECGTTQIGPNAESYEISLSVMSSATAAAGGTTQVATTVEAVGRPLAFNGSSVRCTSKGTLEEALMNVLKWQLTK